MKQALSRFESGLKAEWVLILTLALMLAVSACAPGESPVVVVGDSLSETVQSADANVATQPNGYMSLIARQANFDFRLPLIGTSFLGVVGDTRYRFRINRDLRSWNLGVSGADALSALTEVALTAADGEIGLVLSPRFGQTQMEIAVGLLNSGTSYGVCWIGNNDVLGAVLAFDQLNMSGIDTNMTDPRLFKRLFGAIVKKFKETTKPVFYANIPDVTQISFLVDNEDLKRFLHIEENLLAEGAYTTIVAMFMIRLGLADVDLLQEDNYVLNKDELAMIRRRVLRLNTIIQTSVAQHPLGILVDINSLFNRIHESGYPVDGESLILSTSFLGGLFSLDGVHPSNIGQAIVANAFIQAFNEEYQMAAIPHLSPRALKEIALNDPFVDLDGDGRVRGRPGFGLLETLAPLLGISGDTSEGLASAGLRAVDSASGKALVERYLELKGEEVRRAFSWRRQDSVQMFKDIFGVR
jgi:hypothetical protein